MFLPLFARYVKIPLMTRLSLGFIVGMLLGLGSWYLQVQANMAIAVYLKQYLAPLGTVFISMLKMVVVPIVFFSLMQGASQLPLSRLGKVGVKLLLLYLGTSFFAAIVGVAFALLVNPGRGLQASWLSLADVQEVSQLAAKSNAISQGLFDIILNIFTNPFAALAESNFLAIIVFAILFGLGLSSLKEEAASQSETLVAQGVLVIEQALEAVNRALYKLVSWVMEYAPIGILALTTVNFGVYGPSIVGPYLRVVGGIVIAIFFMVFVVYGLLVKLFTRCSPRDFFRHIKEPMLTAFVTRSSAATLPVSLEAATSKLKVDPEIASFALPMGATINMDGVCVHLPMFAILAANIFDLELGLTQLFSLVVSTVLAAIGTGGVPGGSLMLLFIVLGALGLSNEQTAVVISLALGVNPILDMFETMNNVTGDLLCTYLVGHSNQDNANC